MDLLSTLTGVPGYLNGTLDAHAAGIASMTRDAHHGDTADYEFHPVLNTGIFFSTFMKYGKEKEKTAYHYLPASIKVVPQGKEMTAILTKCGFKEAKFCTFTFGICSMYTGIK